jgi:SIR2-like protein
MSFIRGSTERYRAILRNLATDLLEGKCLLFLGAGACIDPGQPDLPTASELSADMAGKCELEWHDYIPLSTIAFYYESFHTRAGLNKFLANRIGNPKIKPSQTIRLLVEAIEILEKLERTTLAITTNYDRQFEVAYEERLRRRPEVVIYKGAWNPNDKEKILNCTPDGELKGYAQFWLPKQRTVLYKMHGCISQPERQGLVITEEDYINFLANALGEHNADKTILNYVRGEFAMSTILFVGYSLSDWNFRAIFKATVESRLDKKDNRSYAVQFRDPNKQESELEQARWDSVTDFWNEKKVDIISVTAWQFTRDLLDLLRLQVAELEAPAAHEQF